jgi:hypothetical protein
VIFKKDLYPLEPRSGEKKILSFFFFIRPKTEGKLYEQDLDRNGSSGLHTKEFAKPDGTGCPEA